MQGTGSKKRSGKAKLRSLIGAQGAERKTSVTEYMGTMKTTQDRSKLSGSAPSATEKPEERRYKLPFATKLTLAERIQLAKDQLKGARERQTKVAEKIKKLTAKVARLESQATKATSHSESATAKSA
jgi:hypothetical protein